MLVTRDGPQKCRGARHDLRINPMPIHLMVKVLRSLTIDDRRASEPTLCTTKYIIAIFFLWIFIEIKGRNDIKFTSNINQMVGHVSDEMEPIVPINTPVHIYYSFKTTVIEFI